MISKYEKNHVVPKIEGAIWLFKEKGFSPTVENVQQVLATKGLHVRAERVLYLMLNDENLVRAIG